MSSNFTGFIEFQKVCNLYPAGSRRKISSGAWQIHHLTCWRFRLLVNSVRWFPWTVRWFLGLTPLVPCRSVEVIFSCFWFTCGKRWGWGDDVVDRIAMDWIENGSGIGSNLEDTQRSEAEPTKNRYRATGANSRFLQCPQKRSRGNKLIHRRLFKT